jgi:spore germination cell wall hydrolase CwlJ-like protein
MLKQTALYFIAFAVTATPGPAYAGPPAVPGQSEPPTLASSPARVSLAGQQSGAAPAVLTAQDREAIARAAFAEAGNQAEDGLTGVIYTIFNRLHAGTWGATAQEVVNAPGQFEPVTNAGGQWQNLSALSAAQEVEANTILDLILQQRLPDPTHGALYFQNPTIVAQRAADGTVAPSLVNFGGQTPIAVIRDHAFYATFAGSGEPQSIVPLPAPRPSLFVDAKLPTGLAQGEGNPPGLFVPVDATPNTHQEDESAPGLFVAVTAPQPLQAPGFMAPSPGATGN